MNCNYRLLRNGNPVAWFTHADQVETILHSDPSPAWSVEFCALKKPLPMELNEFGWLTFTETSSAYVASLNPSTND